MSIIKVIAIAIAFFLLTSSFEIAAELEAPSIVVTQDHTTVSITWKPISNADGYELLYAPYPYTGPETIKAIEMGDATSLSTELWEGASFYVAVTAYDENGSSDFSNVKLFSISATSEPAPAGTVATFKANSGAVGVAEKVWCPDNSGGFSRVTDYASLPNDPIGDGENKCYMEAFDTSVFTTDALPIQGCSNLDLTKFPGHTCTEISTPEEFRTLQGGNNSIAIIMNDIEIPFGKGAWVGGAITSHWVIGKYDPVNMRPVLIRSHTTIPISWNSTASPNTLQMMNLRINATVGYCVGIGREKMIENNFIGQSITGKCGGRFMIAGFESPSENFTFGVSDQTTYEADDKVYLRSIMARSKNSHTIYLDRTHINWIEDSILLAPKAGGKHPGKFTGKNVVVRNSILTNSGTQGEIYVDPNPDWQIGTPTSLAPLSLAACSRVALDGLTLVNTYDPAGSNPTTIQWQARDALGAGCDLPMGYFPNSYPAQPYYGPVIYNGQRFEDNPYWTPEFWTSIDESQPMTDPGMITSYVTNTQIVQFYTDQDTFQPVVYGLMTAGTVPTTRPDSSSGSGWFLPEITPGWKELTRIVVSGNCLDNGLLTSNLSRMCPHIYDSELPFAAGRISPIDNTEKFIMLGTNQCANNENPASDVLHARDSWLNTLKQPPWIMWE